MPSNCLLQLPLNFISPLTVCCDIGSMSGLFVGLRVRMGVHTANVSEIKRHALTNRAIYDKKLVDMAKLVSETGHGGQIVLTSDALSDLHNHGKFADVAFILHMGGHELEAPLSKSTQGGATDIEMHTSASGQSNNDTANTSCESLAHTTGSTNCLISAGEWP